MSNMVRIEDIIYDGSIYPRKKPSSSVIEEYADALIGGAKFPAIILESTTNRLLDGYHRWKGYAKAKYQMIADGGDGTTFDVVECEYHEIPEGVEPKLYALYLSSKHGLRPTSDEKEIAAQEHFQKHPGCSLELISKYTGVSTKKVKQYIQPLIAKFEEDKRSIIMRLDALGWTQEEISAKLKELWPDAKGIARQSVTDILPEIGNFRFSAKNDLDKGHAPDEIAKRYAIPEIMAWRIALEGLSDAERMERLKIKIQPYDVWNFAKCHNLFGDQHPGRIPGELVAHVLYFFTEPGDMVIDPMAGSGTAVDVCLALGRKCYAYDIDSRHGRSDIIVHNIAVDGPPDRFKKADLIFWDPPYFSKKDGENEKHGYIEGSISRLERNEYLDFFRDSLSMIHSRVKKGAKLAFLMADWDDNTGEQEGVFIWDYANIIMQSGWKLMRHIQVPLSTQQVHPDIVNKFRESRRLARLERYLLVAVK